jgi:hypothetical protein
VVCDAATDRRVTCNEAAPRCYQVLRRERPTRIELASSAWKAEVLPLNYGRELEEFIRSVHCVHEVLPNGVEIWTERRTVPTIRTHDPRVGTAQLHLCRFVVHASYGERVALRQRAHESPLPSSARVAAARTSFARSRTPAVWKAWVADRFERLLRECENFGEYGLVALTT